MSDTSFVYDMQLRNLVQPEWPTSSLTVQLSILTIISLHAPIAFKNKSNTHMLIHASAHIHTHTHLIALH